MVCFGVTATGSPCAVLPPPRTPARTCVVSVTIVNISQYLLRQWLFPTPGAGVRRSPLGPARLMGSGTELTRVGPSHSHSQGFRTETKRIQSVHHKVRTVMGNQVGNQEVARSCSTDQPNRTGDREGEEKEKDRQRRAEGAERSRMGGRASVPVPASSLSSSAVIGSMRHPVFSL